MDGGAGAQLRNRLCRQELRDVRLCCVARLRSAPYTDGGVRDIPGTRKTLRYRAEEI